ncbi:hybrid sensor histidine kinase/response regulator [Yunchengibacter salinarum]|uniref:hybrid sensor histidine kinase/response regulator n=1 Tax=Yunchengibacter salinarum TaxID=3133399 RepID=UPI0035B65693
MRLPKTQSIAFQMPATMVAVVGAAVLVLSVIVTVQAGRFVADEARARLAAVAQKNAREVSRKLEAAYQTADDFSRMLEAMVAEGDTSRQTVHQTMQRLLRANPDFFGIWTGFLPDRFDGRDQDFRGTPSSNAEGNFIPYFYRVGDKLGTRGITDPYNSDYFTRVIATGKPVLVDPTAWPIEGTPTTLATFSLPVRAPSGKTIGVAGTDYTLTFLKAFLGRQRPYGAGRVALFAPNGKVIVPPEDGTTGVRATDFGIPLAHLKEAVAEGTWVSQSYEHADEAVEAIHIPVTVGAIERPWVLSVLVPRSAIFSPVRDLMWLFAALSLGVLLVAAYGAFRFSRRITGPLAKVVSAVEENIHGAGVVPIGYRDRRDEIGTLARMLETYQKTAEERADLKAARTEEEAERRRLEEERRSAEKASAIKSAFVANMSHEIRTPMNGVLGMLSIAREHPMDDDLRQCLEDATNSARYLLDIINDVLDISKIESGNFELRSETFSLTALVRSAVDLLAYKAEEKHLKLTWRIEGQGATTPDLFEGDEVRLKQVLVNLVGNAVKFTDAGSVSLVVAVTGPKGADSGAPGRYDLRFDVSDTGPGLTREDREKVFGRFYQAEDGTERARRGTGLGLAICREIINLMDGRIGVDSKPGAGSRFWFIVPLAPGAVDDSNGQGRRRGLAAPDVDQLHVLVAEDNPVNQKLVQHFLAKIGFRHVSLASNGAEAVEACRTMVFDLVLVDIQMPVMGGEEVLTTLKGELSPCPPIVALTADAMTGDREKYLTLGFDGYVSKPIDKALLEKELMALI